MISFPWIIRLLAVVAVLAFSVACSGDDDHSGDDASPPADDDSASDDDSAADDSAADDDSDDDTGDDDSADDTAGDDSTDDDTADDAADDDTVYPQLVMPPDDGRLYVAAGQVVITPDAVNHPGPIYMGGTGSNRVSTGVHDDLLASVLVLAKGDEHAVIAGLDLVGFPAARTQAVRRGLAERGLDPDKIFVSSTHTHEGPDTMGIWGPDFLTSGASPTYGRFVSQSVVDLVVQLWGEMRPAVMRAGAATVNEPGSNYTDLINDSRQPVVTDPTVAAAQFLDDEGMTIAVLVNWNAHPEVTISTHDISADFPRWTRLRLEELVGGTAVYISGPVGGLETPLDVNIPARDENGDPILDDQGNQVYYIGESFEASMSLGFIIADYAMQGIQNGQAEPSPDLHTTHADFPVPILNPLHGLAYLFGLVEPVELITDRPGFCGLVGCSPEFIGLIRVGPVAVVTSPGETLAETLLGRPESVTDYGAPWGPFTFPAIDGYLAHLDAAVPMHQALCGDELGYFIPQSDRHPSGHPDYYEEYYAVAPNVETLYRETAIALVSGGGENFLNSNF